MIRFGMKIYTKLWVLRIRSSLKRHTKTDFTGGVDRDKLKADLQPIIDKYAGILANSTSQLAPKVFKPGYSGYMPPAPSGLSMFGANTDKTTKAANTSADAAERMFNAAGVLANVANAATKQPTYIIVDTTGKKKTGNVPLDIFINSGVTPIPFSGVYP